MSIAAVFRLVSGARLSCRRVIINRATPGVLGVARIQTGAPGSTVVRLMLFDCGAQISYKFIDGGNKTEHNKPYTYQGCCG